MPPTRPDKPMREMFETRSHAWRAVGLERELARSQLARARKQAIWAILLLPLLIGVVILYSHRRALFPGSGQAARIVTVVVLVIVGWAFARAVGRALAPSLFRRLDPGTAGTVGFLIRLATIALAVLVALRIAGLDPRTLAIGGAVTAVVFGLAAQQTFGNLLAGTVLLSARPFKVGERIRLQGGPVGGRLEGVVSSLGLLYTALASGDDRILIPNSVVLQLAIMPVSEPDQVTLRARFPADIRPSALQELLDGIEVPTRSRPDIQLEEFDGDEVVVRISAAPQNTSEGPRLADEMLAAIAGAQPARPSVDGIERPDGPPAGPAGGGGDAEPATAQLEERS
ncbi:MAG: mechanosensitive ion channel family protein [Actinobacteria bacterium]|nr:mechanosensitive ion channel family protein [Actinomycetota bacterium]